MSEERKDYFLQRGFTAEIRAAGEDSEKSGSIVEGLAAVYEQETRIADIFGEFVEVIRTGAFDNCDFDDVKLLINHDTRNIPLARSRRNNKSDKPNTMQLTVDSKGINFSADLDTVNNEVSRAAYSAVNRGDMDGMSFMFIVPEDGQKWTKKDGVDYREITKIERVLEVSIVNFPAYQGTNIHSRSFESDKRALENARSQLENRQQQTKTDYKAKALTIMYTKGK